MRTLLLSLTVLALGLGGVFFANSPRASARTTTTPIITGSVGSSDNPDAYRISLSRTTVPPGTYQFNITDYSGIHNFDLCKGTSCTATSSLHKTTIPGDGSVSWTVTLAAGPYTVQCDAHSSSMRLRLNVAPTVQITSVVAKRTLVTVSAKASYSTHFTATLLPLKGTTKLATASSSVNATTATLKLKPATALRPGYYYVQVQVGCCGAFTTVKKKIQVM